MVEAPTSPTVSGIGRRRALWAGAVLVLLVVLALAWLPSVVARNLLASEFERFGIALDGLTTVDVDLLDATVTLGPIALGAPGAAPARVTRVELGIDPGALLDDRIVIEHATLTGIALRIRRTGTGALDVNGVPVGGAIIGSFSGRPPREVVRNLLGGRDLGVEQLEVHDARVAFEIADEDEPRIVDVGFAGLDGFASWDPERAARFELTAGHRGAEARWTGSASLLAREPSIAADLALDGVALADVGMLFGAPLAARPEGSVNFRGHHALRLLDTGSIAGSVRGTAELSGLTLAREGAESLSVPHVAVDIEAGHGVGAAGAWTVDGRLDLSARQPSFEIAGEARFETQALAMSLDGVELARAADGSISAQWNSTIDAVEPRFAGRIRLSADILINVVRVLQYLAASTDPDEQITGIEEWANRGVSIPRSRVQASRLTVVDHAFEYRGGDGTFELTLDTKARADDVSVRSRAQETRIERLELALEEIGVGAADQHVTLEGNMTVDASELEGERERGRAQGRSMGLRVERVALRSEGATVSAEIGVEFEVEGIRGSTVAGPAASPASFALEGGRARIDEATVEASPEKGRWSIRGSVEGDGAALDVGLAQLSTARVERIEARDIALDETLRIRAATVMLTEPSVAATRSFVAGMLSGSPGAETGAAPARTAPTGRELVEDVQWKLEELGHDPGEIDGLVGPRTKGAVESFQRAAGLEIDGQVSEALRVALEAASAPDAPQAAPARDRRPTFAIDELGTVGGARVHFSDDGVHPDVDTHVRFETLSLGGIDTGDVERETTIRASAQINEFSEIEVSGSITPLKRPPDLALDLRLTNLELAPYSPYAVQLLGVTLDEGVLGSRTTAQVTDGDIDAVVTLDLSRLDLQTLSDEDAERIAAAIGVRPETALSLLKDSEGRIELTIPVSGTLAEPDVNVDQAVNRAVVGVLAAIFPPNIVAAMFRGEDDDVTFEPVVFEPGSDALGEAAREYLDRLATLMGEHPGVVISLCGRAVADDAMAVARDLSARLGVAIEAREGESGAIDRRVSSHAGALAVERSRSVRRHLVGEHGIAAAAITECRAGFDADDTGPPRVEVTL